MHPKLHLFLEVGVGSHRSCGVGNTHFLASQRRKYNTTYLIFYFHLFDFSLFHIQYTYWVNDAEPTEQRLCQYTPYKG